LNWRRINALNAANARWGSLYDALYGTDVLPEVDGAEKGKGYNPVRGAKVIEYARHVLDRTAPLARGSHLDSTGYAVKGGALVVTLKDGSNVKYLIKPPQAEALEAARKEGISKEKVSSWEMSQIGTAFNFGEISLPLGVAVKIAN